MQKSIKLILTGVTGMVGEGVMHECLNHPSVSQVLVLGRRACGFQHAKLSEIVHDNLYDLSAIEHQLAGFDGCLFCLGTSSVGKNEEEFTKISYTLTMHVAETLSRQNANMVFCYISGAGTDGTEKGKTMWARVKGKTENDLKKLSFKAVYNFRPGYLHPTEGLKNTLPYYKYVSWLYPILRPISGSWMSRLSELGVAMIDVVLRGYEKSVVEVKDIHRILKSVGNSH
jgi:uncharacterized protein YbjT (DUF2867 family)